MLHPGRGDVSDVESAIITHEQNQSNRQTLDTAVSNFLKSDYIEITTAVVASCVATLNHLPVHRYTSVLLFIIIIIWSF